MIALRPNHAPRGHVRQGFTLLEVLLAIVIALGLLVVAIHFHHQTATLRSAVLLESDQLAQIRLVLDRLSRELRCALPPPQGRFAGTASSIEFTTLNCLPLTAWRAEPASADSTYPGVLQPIAYRLTASGPDSNSVPAGVLRSDLSHSETNGTTVTPTAESTADPAASIARENAQDSGQLLDAIRQLQFRYWDGSAWHIEWNRQDLPLGVEVKIGTDPAEPDPATPDAPVVYRRVIYLPTSSPGSTPVDSGSSSFPHETLSSEPAARLARHGTEGTAP